MLIVMLLGGCEMDPQPPPPPRLLPDPPPNDNSPVPSITTHRQIVDVTVLEYGSNAPIGDAMVELQRKLPLQIISDTTSDAGRVRFDLATEDWTVTRIQAPDYMTSCPPTFEDNDWHHPLVSKRHDGDRDEYTCLLVPRKALRVPDETSALRSARANTEVAPWLRSHPSASVARVDRRGAHWEVLFVMPGDGVELRSVIVDGFDGHTRVDMSIDDFGAPPYGYDTSLNFDAQLVPGNYYYFATGK